MKKTNTPYKDVNDNKIDFKGQTKAAVKTNKTTLQLPLLITKANIMPLEGLDRERLEITINSNNTDANKIHNIRLHDSVKKIMKLKNEIKDFFSNNNELKLGSKSKSDGRREHHATKRTTDINSFTWSGRRGIKKTDKEQQLGKSNRNKWRLFRSKSSRIYNKKGKSTKIALDLRKLNEAQIKRKAQMPNLEELISRKLRKISEGKECEIWITKLDLDNVNAQTKLDKK